MPEDFYASRPVKTGPSLKLYLFAGLLSFAGGAALIGYLAWTGTITFGQDKPPVAVSAPAPVAPPQVAGGQPVAAFDQHVAALEQRLARLDLQAAAFDGSSARAEGLLVAMAARRAIDRGKPLGYLENELRLRFGAARPDAVRSVIDGAKAAVTLDMLAAQLDYLGPALLGHPEDESGWKGFTRTLSRLFVVRRDTATARPAPQQLDQARLLVRSGRVAEAIQQISRLPGSGAAQQWTANAQRYATTQTALDQIEQAALNEPELLKGSSGETVRQPGLEAAATTTAVATPSTAPTPTATASAAPR